MTKILILLILLTGMSQVSAQKNGKSDESYNLCEGAINIFDNGDFRLKFTGKKSDVKAFDDYASLSEFNTENILWCSYVAPEAGHLTFRGTLRENFVQMVVFSEEKHAVCEDINNGIAEIKRLHISKKDQSVGLDYKVEGGIMYTLSLKEGEHIMIAFATQSDFKTDLMLQWQFVSSEIIEEETKIVDKRHDDFATTLSFKVRDKETNRPIISSLALEGHKSLSGLYTGSEFYFNLERNSKINVKCEAEGFFYYDSLYELSNFEDIEISIVLDKISSGKSMTVEEIEFVPGTSEITQSSLPNLRRLKDFLALNSDLNIEIQGHVFALGDNTFAAQKVSEARAKRVMKYLVQNGIDKKRLVAKGYGNTQPIYAEPKFFYEEQANRRVEILVK